MLFGGPAPVLGEAPNPPVAVFFGGGAPCLEEGPNPDPNGDTACLVFSDPKGEVDCFAAAALFVDDVAPCLGEEPNPDPKGDAA